MGTGGHAFGITLEFRQYHWGDPVFSRGDCQSLLRVSRNSSGNSFSITAVTWWDRRGYRGPSGKHCGVLWWKSRDNSATVNNPGILTITDKDDNLFTAQVSWYTIFSEDTLGGINDIPMVNLSDFHYSGANPDLQGWLADQTAVVVFSGKDLSVLTTSRIMRPRSPGPSAPCRRLRLAAAGHWLGGVGRTAPSGEG